MNSFTKPNINLPISLHDARVSEMHVFPSSPDKQDGIVTFVFENGYKLVRNPDICQTGRATIKFSGIDFEFSRVYYYKENQRQEISFEKLSEDIGTNALDIIDECYGYNFSKFSCCMISADSCHDVEIEIYHFNTTLYEWED